MIKFLKGKVWQVKFIIKKITKDVYYGIKWLVCYNTIPKYKSGDPITNHPDYEQILKNVNSVCKADYHNKSVGGVEYRGEICVVGSQIPIPNFSDQEKKSLIQHYTGMEWDNILKKAEKDLNIKFTKTQKNDILKASDPSNFNTTKLKIKEIYEKKQSKKSKKTKTTRKSK